MTTMPKIDIPRSTLCTVLWVKQDQNSNWRVLNMINFASKFEFVNTTVDMNKPEVQLSVAQELRDGWKTNGPWPFAQFKIQQFQLGEVFNED